MAIPPFLTPSVVAEHEGVENRSAQPRDYRSAKGYAAEGRKERDGDKLGRRKSLQTPPVSLTLFSFLGRLLDDFMPHKNDIKFVKTERRNDRYGSAVWSGRLRAGEKSKSWKGGKREGEKRKSKQIAEDGRPLTIRFPRGDENQGKFRKLWKWTRKNVYNLRLVLLLSISRTFRFFFRLISPSRGMFSRTWFEFGFLSNLISNDEENSIVNIILNCDSRKKRIFDLLIDRSYLRSCRCTFTPMHLYRDEFLYFRTVL